ncbi:hypothetical protein ACTJJ7_20185 [Phyllobacterium sp. 22229]|uniref:hypothetical protein n=1 Tax=Phyllobacterium sp. 22229 TaxID=3453895 RepID=UPI003F842142
MRYLEQQKFPFTVTVETGRKRTIEQNKLQRLWMKEVSEQLGESAEYWRGYCKLTIGVPILRSENEEFQEKYDDVVKALPYEQKLAIMTEPLDLPVTRLMTTKQKTKYLDLVFRHFSEQGVALTLPEPLARAA